MPVLPTRPHENLDEDSEKGIEAQPSPSCNLPKASVQKVKGAKGRTPGPSRSLDPVSARFFLELWAGSGGLSKAIRDLGFPVLEPIELFTPEGRTRPEMDLRCPRVQRRLEDLAEAGALAGVHCGITCRTFSQLFRVFGSGTRSADQPEGSGSRDDEVAANRDARWMCDFLRIVWRRGGWFTIENPSASYLWHLPCVQELCREIECYRVSFDQCTFGLGAPRGSVPPGVLEKANGFVGVGPSVPGASPTLY